MSLSRFLASPLTYFTPVRREAAKAPRRRVPTMGTTLCCNQFRLTVPAGMSRDLWQWLSGQGWYELAAGENRYKFRALPSNVVAALVDASPDDREKLLALAMRRAMEHGSSERVAA